MSVTPIRLFDVECQCGGEFRVSLETAEPQPGDGFLAPPSGQCPHCGLKLDEIEPPGPPA